MAKDSDRFKAGQSALLPVITPSSSVLTLPLRQIADRPGQSTRSLNEDHVIALMESIGAVGLIQPLAVDQQGRLLAGGHRKAAIEKLLVYNFSAYNQWFSEGIPVHRYDFDALEDEVRALAVEVSENEKRRDYTHSEVRRLAERLREAGYKDLRGRPKSRQKSVVLVLATIIGKSDKTVRRYLSSDKLSQGRQVSSFSSEQAKRQIERWLGQADVPVKIEKLLRELERELE
jgi:ParB family transcriptional regulator, chromosome partitioning protein